MELTRELYWNVGHGPVTLIPMYVLIILAAGIMIKYFLQRIRMYEKGLPLKRDDQLAKRISKAIFAALFQKKVIKGSGAGLAHGLFFWGFLTLVLGTALVFIQADFTDLFFGKKFLTGQFYLVFSLCLDIAGLVCMVMLIGLLVRRYLSSDGLPITQADTAMHVVLLATLVTGFMVEGARMAATELGTSLSYYSPVGLVFALPISGISEAGLRALHNVFWWIHLGFVAGFFVLIPFTRLKHMVLTALNYVFEADDPKSKLSILDLEDEEAESFGATNLHELTWKDIFDTDACTACMRCQDICPAHNTGKPLSPMRLIHDLGRIAEHDPDANLFETIGEDVLWSCTTCGGCQKVCPATIEHVPKIIESRRAMVLTHATFPQEVTGTFNNLENQANPWGFAADTRADWAKDLDVPLMMDKPDTKVLYFVGCAGSFDDRGKKISQATARVLKKAGVDFAILGPEESCNGDMARRAGNEYLGQMMIMQNIETINQYKPELILTGCPHCYNTLKNEYPEFGGDYEVVHYTDYFNTLISDGKLTINSKDFGKMTFHDSCYLGRWNDIYESPRKLLKAANKDGLVEMGQNMEKSMCCGAGGARMFMEETIGERINNVRAKQAVDTGAETVAASCPFCATMLNDGIMETDKKIPVKDIAEIIDEATE
ncbi:MAG: 4Fe-4S dicluster domain-containing protein [Desulfobacterales bacterium]|nr:4Fe-4S dicluster domain-containing protein [Desulfobacterales bacterium]